MKRFIAKSLNEHTHRSLVREITKELIICVVIVSVSVAAVLLIWG